MPTPWSMVDAAFPTFTGEENVKDQVTKLCDYMYLLVEELKYQLSNLNAKNFNANALTTLKEETTADVEAGLLDASQQLALVVGAVADVIAKMDDTEEQINQLETDMSWLEKGQEDMAAELERMALTLEELLEALKPDTEGGVTIGNDGQEVHLVGRVYINGVLME